MIEIVEEPMYSMQQCRRCVSSSSIYMLMLLSCLYTCVCLSECYLCVECLSNISLVMKALVNRRASCKTEVEDNDEGKKRDRIMHM